MAVYLIVINPAAGKSDYQHKLSSLKSFFDASKCTFKEYFTQPTKSSSHLNQYLLSDKSITDIAIIGGDGTINICINALPHFNYNLTIVNNGTGNDSIKNIYPKKSLAEQITTTIYGEIKKIDIGKCNDRLFMNGVGIGFDGLVVQKRANLSKKKRGLWSYLSIVLLLLPRKTEFPLNLKTNDNQSFEHIFSMTITKGTTFGGGFIMNPFAKPTDGLLDICTFKRINLIEKMIILPWVLIGKHGLFPKIRFSKSKQIEIKSPVIIPAHIDGELIESKEFTFEILPEKLRIRV